MSDIVKVSLVDGVAEVRMNRPETRNALSDSLFDELAEAFGRLERDSGVHVIVLTGTGRGFCSGGDVQEMPASSATRSFEQRVTSLRRRARTIARIYACPKLTVAKVNGAAVGAGWALALACDFRLAAESAVFISGFIRIGLSGDCGAIYLLQRLIGEARAKELFFLSDPLSARDALTWSAITRCIPDQCLDADTAAFAARLARGPHLAQSNMKQNFQSAHLSLEEAIDVEAERLVRSALAPDHAEARQAFLEKRAPQFER